jgi:hypothetical protein
MKWRRRRFQRLRRANEVLSPEYEKLWLGSFKRRSSPSELRRLADVFSRAGYIQHAARLKEVAHTIERSTRAVTVSDYSSIKGYDVSAARK